MGWQGLKTRVPSGSISENRREQLDFRAENMRNLHSCLVILSLSMGPTLGIKY